MTDADKPATGSSRGRGLAAAISLQLVLSVLTGALVVAFLAVATLRVVHPDTLSSARAAATDAQERDEEVLAAARRVALAFLDVDYRDLEPRMDKVLALATGTFKKEYQASAVDFAAAAREGHAISQGEIPRIGIAEIDDDSAIVYVAADQTVSNLATEEAKKKGLKYDDQRIYRFEFNMTRVGDRWLLSGLKAVT